MSERSTAALDTNVLVSALLNPFGAPGRIWDLVTGRQLQLAYDDRVIIEYEQVLRRPKFGFPPDRVDAVLAILAFQTPVTAEPWPYRPLPYEDDAKFLEVAKAGNCPLISGNLRHYPKRARGSVTVMAPSEWLAHQFEA